MRLPRIPEGSEIVIPRHATRDSKDTYELLLTQLRIEVEGVIARAAAEAAKQECE